MKRKKRKKFKRALETKFYRNDLHRCGQCQHIPKILLRVYGWERRVCISCAKKIGDELGMVIKLPKKKNLKLPGEKAGIFDWVWGKKKHGHV